MFVNEFYEQNAELFLQLKNYHTKITLSQRGKEETMPGMYLIHNTNHCQRLPLRKIQLAE